MLDDPLSQTIGFSLDSNSSPSWYIFDLIESDIRGTSDDLKSTVWSCLLHVRPNCIIHSMLIIALTRYTI